MRAPRVAQASAWHSMNPQEIFAVNVVMRKGEHKAEKGSSEKGINLNLPEITQLEVLGFAQEPGGQAPHWLSYLLPRPPGWGLDVVLRALYICPFSKRRGL